MYIIKSETAWAEIIIMSWPLKISFRPNSYKELIKELKIDSNSIILTILFSACQIFGVQDPHLCTLLYNFISLICSSWINFYL